jgi:hypothetical protein
VVVIVSGVTGTGKTEEAVVGAGVVGAFVDDAFRGRFFFAGVVVVWVGLDVPVVVMVEVVYIVAFAGVVLLAVRGRLDRLVSDIRGLWSGSDPSVMELTRRRVVALVIWRVFVGIVG